MIYLDNAATTHPHTEALEHARQFYEEYYYNPSARYRGGFAVNAKISEARATILNLIADSLKFDLIFTSCGSESDNQAIFSAAKRGNAVTTAGEHSAVERSFNELKARGVEARFAPIERDGSVKCEKLLELVDEKTTLVSVVHVNNETGAINDVAAIAKAVKAKNPRTVFHADGVQAYGKISFKLTSEIDLYSLSAHKIGAIKGIGALIKRKSLVVSPYIYGGGQENGLRSGTENVLGILDFCSAAEYKFKTLAKDAERLTEYRELLWSLLDKENFMRISPEDGTPYILTVAAFGVRGEVVQRLLWDRGIVVGTGSACSSKKPFSRVIAACGYAREVLEGVLRISFSSETTESEVIEAAKNINEVVKQFKEKI